MEFESSDADAPRETPAHSVGRDLRRRRDRRAHRLSVGHVHIAAAAASRSISGRRQSAGGRRVVRRGDVRLTLRALGAVTPLATVTVTTQINGYLMSVGFKEGQLVTRDSCWRRSIRGPTKWPWNRTGRSSPATKRRSNRRRWTSSATRRSPTSSRSPRQTYEDQVWTVKQDQGTVDYDKAQIKAQQLNLTYCHIVAPTDGRVGSAPGRSRAIMCRPAPPPASWCSRSSIRRRWNSRYRRTACRRSWRASIPARCCPVTAFDRANVTQLATGQLAAVDTQVNTTTGTVMLRANFENPTSGSTPASSSTW